MKSPARCALSLLLTLALVLAPAACAEGEATPPPEAPTPPALSLDRSSLTLDPGENILCKATVEPSGNYGVSWTSSAPTVASVNDGSVTALAPGKATITASVKEFPEVKANCEVIVSGIALSATTLELLENEQRPLPTYTLYGAAAEAGKVSWSSSNPSAVRLNVPVADGLAVGTSTLTLSVGAYSTKVEAVVRTNQAQTITASASASKPLALSTLQTELDNQCLAKTGSRLSYLTGLVVSTAEGTLYLNYRSPDDTGAGVAQSASYFVSSAARGPYLTDITFVPNPYFAGDRATIRYSGTAANGRTFQGNLSVALEAVSNNVTLTATPTSPAVLGSSRLSQVCQQMTGGALSYVTFTLPAENRGVLYYDYVDAGNYGAKLAAGAKYSLSELDRISFLPAQVFTGTVILYYTGYSTAGARYNGQITVTVSRNAEEGELEYSTGPKGVVTFREGDFYDYCRSLTGQTLSYVRFTLPPSSQGTLYSGYQSSANYGSPVAEGVGYYYSRTPRLSQVSFVPAEGFTGTVRIPFNGWDTAGNRFAGTVSIQVRSSGAGRVWYSCIVGQSVKLVSSDFNELSQSLTGSSLRYITFHALPDWRAGELYYNRTASNSGSSLSRNTRYSYSYLSGVSFWAGSSFTGSTEVPFTGEAGNGDTFTGTLVIDAVSRSQQAITYSTGYRQARLFQPDDFNSLSRSLTGSQLNYVRFELPSASQGTLYYGYRSDGSYDSQVSSSTNYYRSGSRALGQVSFLPATGFSGTATVSFTGTATDGSQFSGVVDITVGTPKVTATVSYSTRYAPVTFRTADFAGAYSSGQLTSLRLDALPSATAGKLYGQYSSPTQYNILAATGTDYRVSTAPLISGLTFVPKAGFRGTVTIPYTGTNTDGTKYMGQISILVEPTYTSAYFSDMAGQPSQALAAVDYLYENKVVSGMGGGQYGPSLLIRRGDFALMLHRAFQFYAPSAGAPFADVGRNDYYAQAINTMRSLGIVNGMGENLFQPQGIITRQDAILMVQRALRTAGWGAGDGDKTILSSYRDGSEVSSYALGSMAFAVQADLLPHDGTRLAPKAPLTRVDMAQILHRALTY